LQKAGFGKMCGLRPGRPVRASGRANERFIVNNSWIHIAVWTVVLGTIFGYLWWQGQIQRLKAYVDETREELKKCSWPSWIELRGSTILIIVTVGLLGLFVVVVDRILFTIFIH
jgi:preprotein translocase subunit SecE